MVPIEEYDATVRVFKWDAKLLVKRSEWRDANSSSSSEPQHPPTSNPSRSYRGAFVVRATILFPDGDHFVQVREICTVPYTTRKLRYLLNMDTRKQLLFQTIQQLPFLRSCDKVNPLVNGLAAELGCKFRFSPELILNEENPKLVIFLDLRMRSTEKSDDHVDDVMQLILRSVGNNDDDDNSVEDLQARSHGQLIHEEGHEGIEDYLKHHPGIVAVEPGEFDEIKAALEIKLLNCEDRDEDDDGRLIGNHNNNNNNIASDENDSEARMKVCPICLERLSDGAIVAETCCSHVFHRDCVYNWLLRANSCPMCRSSVEINSV